MKNTNQHPHILLICTDEQAPQYMGCMGDPLARTPNLDRLAARGVLFRNAYCNNPICVPGRYSILTGKYVRELGSLEYGSGLDPQTWTYPKHFARAGYQTTCVGKQHFMGREQMHGWMFRPYGDMELSHVRWKIPGYAGDPFAGQLGDIPDTPPNNLAHWVRAAGPSEKGFIHFDRMTTACAELHLRDYFQPFIMGEYQPDRPLLFQVSYKCPHWPFWAPEDLFRYYRERVQLPRIPADDPGNFCLDAFRRTESPFENTDEEVLNARAANYALIELADREIGKILDCAQSLGILDDMLVLMHCDHGELNGNHGCWGKGRAYEHSVRVPLMISLPGTIPAGAVVDAPVSNLDIFPTLCDYAGIEPPEGLRGESLRGLIDGNDPERWAARPIISEFFSYRRGWSMVRQGRFKYVDYWAHPHDKVPLDNWDRTGWLRASQLFDLQADPDERTNLAGQPAHVQTCAELQTILDALPVPFRWDELSETQFPISGGEKE